MESFTKAMIVVLFILCFGSLTLIVTAPDEYTDKKGKCYDKYGSEIIGIECLTSGGVPVSAKIFSAITFPLLFLFMVYRTLKEDEEWTSTR